MKANINKVLNPKSRRNDKSKRAEMRKMATRIFFFLNHLSSRPEIFYSLSEPDKIVSHFKRGGEVAAWECTLAVRNHLLPLHEPVVIQGS